MVWFLMFIFLFLKWKQGNPRCQGISQLVFSCAYESTVLKVSHRHAQYQFLLIIISERGIYEWKLLLRFNCYVYMFFDFNWKTVLLGKCSHALLILKTVYLHLISEVFIFEVSETYIQMLPCNNCLIWMGNPF